MRSAKFAGARAARMAILRAFTRKRALEQVVHSLAQLRQPERNRINEFVHFALAREANAGRAQMMRAETNLFRE